MNWDAGQKLVAEWHRQGSPVGESLLEGAKEKFLADCDARNLRKATKDKYKLLFREFVPFCSGRGVLRLKQIDVDLLREFRSAWKLSPVSARKKLERLRTFLKFCQESGWIERNAALQLKPPRAEQRPTLPFSKQEMEKIMWALDLYPDYRGHRAKMKAFVLLLRYSGLRIRDAVTLRRERVDEEKLFLYTQKTNIPVSIPLPNSVIEALEACGTGAEEHFFWSGNGEPKSAVADWQRGLKRLFGIAGVRGHAHRFRDTFSVSLLEAGIPLEQVSVLLGHTSIKTTERHYAPWVKSRQDKLEEAVKKTWV